MAGERKSLRVDLLVVLFRRENSIVLVEVCSI